MPDISIDMTPAVFYILLSLSTQERHGYDIMKQVRIDSYKKFSMGPGTLYGTIKRLLTVDYIEEVTDAITNENGDERRRYYRITGYGREALMQELERCKDIIDMAEEKKLIKARPLFSLR